ncbi:hypothetical protein Snov_3369 [Ancylobacter novellus DSM 506]|uniref:Uncharacterized protein n=1 Tax=Ancylobacter novellus (strain ATCC 8093 / DSM 506 / JCM 20403 / CCM 1077 / IAM 12100 / NBRC 12443 / NCIMB 10456) TaxID=639283 RepID=D7A981_ANCN5|nr:hypothetical protein Snov_3369 [Ancylobacter novellus DSM 506]
MRQTEETARRICALDLRARGIAEKDIPAMVDRYWPVLANEIRQGIVVGEWPFQATDIEQLTQEYQGLLDGR